FLSLFISSDIELYTSIFFDILKISEYSEEKLHKSDSNNKSYCLSLKLFKIAHFCSFESALVVANHNNINKNAIVDI
ncbi:hypothetical protein GW891_00995, partial [bacterium]|nr:hypothetical protein [bacterium]